MFSYLHTQALPVTSGLAATMLHHSVYTLLLDVDMPLAAHILLEEVGAAYEAIEVSISGGEHRKPEFLDRNPKGRIPVRVEGVWLSVVTDRSEWLELGEDEGLGEEL